MVKGTQGYILRERKKFRHIPLLFPFLLILFFYSISLETRRNDPNERGQRWKNFLPYSYKTKCVRINGQRLSNDSPKVTQNIHTPSNLSNKKQSRNLLCQSHQHLRLDMQIHDLWFQVKIGHGLPYCQVKCMNTMYIRLGKSWNEHF